MKRVLKIAGIVLAVLVGIVVLYVLVMTVTDYRPAEVEQVTPDRNAEDNLPVEQTLSIMTYNIGYGANGPDYDFFMDGGAKSWGVSREAVQSNIQGILSTLTDQAPDLMLIQEVDEQSTRSYSIDQRSALQTAFPEYASLFAINYKVLFVPIPITQPYGRVLGGIQTLSRYRVEPEAYRRQLDELTELLDLGEILRTPARQLSLGQRMRCEIAGSLLHSPRLLFLDEPTIGLDAVSKRAVREFIRRINREKKTTVILTTHDMQDIEALAQRILLIGKGRILLDGTLEQLKKRHGGQKRLAVDYGEKGPDETVLLPAGLSAAGKAEGRQLYEVDTALLSVSEAMAALSQLGEVRDLTVTEPTAEELVVSLYREFHL